jgi:hypothetical protein
MPSQDARRLAQQQHRRQQARLIPEEVQNPIVSAWDCAGDLGFQPPLSRTEVLAIFNASTRKAAQDIFDKETRGTSPIESKLMLRFGRALREACLREAEVLLQRCL